MEHLHIFGKLDILSHESGVKMGVDGNAMASLEFIDSVCTVKDGKS